MSRKLTAAEYSMWLGAQIAPSNFTMLARVSGGFSLDQLQEALGKARRRHPLLAVRAAVDHAGWPHFVSEDMPVLPVRVVERSSNDDWMQEVAAELVRPFTWKTGPLIRLVWLKAEDISDILVVCHHCVADGLSVAYLIRDLLHYLGQPEAMVEPLPLLPGSAELIPARFTNSVPILLKARLLATLFKGWLRFRQLKKKLVGSDKKEIANTLKYAVLPWVLTEPQTSALVAGCRQEQATVHAALCTAFLRAFAEEQAGKKVWRRRVSSPVSLRGHLNRPVGEGFGVFIALTKIVVDCRPARDFWEIARDVKRQFAREVTDEALFRYVANVNAVVKAIAKDLSLAIIEDSWPPSVDYDLSITNLGRLDFPRQYGPLQLEAMYGPSVSGIPQENVLGVTTVGRRMFFTFVVTDMGLGIPKAERIKERAMQHLAEAVGW